jgi:hypothetical protein
LDVLNGYFCGVFLLDVLNGYFCGVFLLELNIIHPKKGGGLSEAKGGMRSGSRRYYYKCPYKIEKRYKQILYSINITIY